MPARRAEATPPHPGRVSRSGAHAHAHAGSFTSHRESNTGGRRMSALDAFSTIIRPVVSEKSTVLGDHGKYVFEVAPEANKIQIKRAVEEAFANKKVQV